MERLKSKELWIAQCYNGDAALVNEENDEILNPDVQKKV